MQRYSSISGDREAERGTGPAPIRGDWATRAYWWPGDGSGTPLNSYETGVGKVGGFADLGSQVVPSREETAAFNELDFWVGGWTMHVQERSSVALRQGPRLVLRGWGAYWPRPWPSVTRRS